MSLKIKLVNNRAKIPTRGSRDAAGFDLYSVEEKILKPGERATVDFGLQIELPRGYFGQICGRSGLARNSGIITGGGIIDNDYRGNIMVILINTSNEAMKIEIGSRVAQLLCVPYLIPVIEEVTSLSCTERNDSGFGSSG